MKISLSFKENEEYIYNYIKKQLSASVYIKQLVIDDMKKDESPNKKIQTNKSRCGIEWD